MKVEINLQGKITKKEIIQIFGEVLEFGGPDGNMPADREHNKGWGMNWDAMDDSLYSLEEFGARVKNLISLLKLRLLTTKNFKNLTQKILKYFGQF